VGGGSLPCSLDQSNDPVMRKVTFDLVEHHITPRLSPSHVRFGEVLLTSQLIASGRQGAVWLGFWLDSKLSFKTHFENRMANAKGALQRVSSLNRSNVRIGDLVEGPERQIGEGTSIAEQAGKGHHRAVAVNPSSLSRNRIVLNHRTRSPGPPPDQVRSASAQCEWRPPYAPAPAC
jgi:hypothetical protein